MSDIEIVTVSSKGQVSIPADIRRELDLGKGSKLLAVSKGDNILLKKIDADVIDQSFEEILKPMWENAEKEGLDEEDVEKLIYDHRGVESG